MRYFLLKIAATITRKHRGMPAIVWYEKSWLGNIFRLKEYLFGLEVAQRPDGKFHFLVHPEHASGQNEDGSQWQNSYTWENAAVVFESMVRAWRPGRVRIAINLPQLPIWLNPLMQFSPAFAIVGGRMPGRTMDGKHYVFSTIAFDAAAGFTTTYSATLAHTITGSNPFLFSQESGDSGAKPSPWTATWNGSENMTDNTSIDSDQGGVDRWSRIRTLGAPSTGTHNIVSSGSTFSRLGAMSWSGAQASSVIDSGAFTVSGTGAGDITVTTTVVANPCWLGGYSNYTNGSAGAGTTVRGLKADNQMMCDSGADVASGSRSLAMTKFGTAAGMMQVISFAPFPSAVAVPPARHIFFG